MYLYQCTVMECVKIYTGSQGITTTPTVLSEVSCMIHTTGTVRQDLCSCGLHDTTQLWLESDLGSLVDYQASW